MVAEIERVFRKDQRTAGGEGDEHFEDREVEADGGGKQHAGEFFRLIDGFGPADEGDGVAVFDGDALGQAGGARGVDHVGEIGRSGGGCGAVRGVLERFIDEDAAAAVFRRQGIGERALGEQDRRGGVLEDVGDAVLGIFRVDGHVGTTGFQDGEDGDDGFRPAFRADADEGFAGDSIALEFGGERVGVAVEFLIGETAVPGAQSDGMGMAIRLFLEEAVHRWLGGERAFGGVPCVERAAVLRRQHVELLECGVAVGDDGIR